MSLANGSIMVPIYQSTFEYPKDIIICRCCPQGHYVKLCQRFGSKATEPRSHCNNLRDLSILSVSCISTYLIYGVLCKLDILNL